MTGIKQAACGFLDVGRAMVLAIAALGVLYLLGLGLVLLPVAGLGLVVLGYAVVPHRALASAQRRWVARRLGTDVPEPSWPDKDTTAPPSMLRAFWLLVRCPAAWRHTSWLVWQVSAGIALPLLIALPVYAGVAVVDGGGKSLGNTVARVVFAVALSALSLPLAPILTRGHAIVCRWLLAAPGNRSRLDRRADELQRSRSATIRAQEHLVRRIERDLHDGTQAHVVSAGITIGMARSMLPNAPDKADELLAEAAQTVADTLDELRAIVHGIRPPVLAERGLAEAARAAAARCPIPVDQNIELPGPFPAELETAVYFAIAETLTNVAKHSGASRATLALTHGSGKLTARVTDDGRGGANIGAGSGLQGLRERIGAFDGTVLVDSPAGGPTEIRMEVPCEPLSPKTSLFSATG